MKIIYIFIVFIIVSIAQIWVPIHMIMDSEKALVSGKAYKFKTRPIDPTDPFRGKYITLQYEINRFNSKDSYIKGEEIYVYLKEDKEGFAEVSDVSKVLLPNKGDYVLANVIYDREDLVSFQLPFNVFYMEESKAYDAELAYNRINRDSSSNNVYALVYIKDDKAVLENVFIDDIPISEYVEK